MPVKVPVVFDELRYSLGIYPGGDYYVHLPIEIGQRFWNGAEQYGKLVEEGREERCSSVCCVQGAKMYMRPVAVVGEKVRIVA